VACGRIAGAVPGGTMKFGIFLMAVHPGGDPIAARLREHIEQVRAIRDAGFDSLVLGQHFVTAPIQMIQPVPLLARLIPEAGHLTLVVGVFVVPLLHPVLTAEEVAALDVLAEGRTVCGVGLGYRQAEYAAFGVPYGERVARFTESLAVMKRLWSEERVTFEGRFWRLRDVGIAPRPIQQPHPPIWLAADVDAAVRRAARVADAWYINPRTGLDELVRQLGVYQDALRAEGKPFPVEFPIRREMYIARDKATAVREAQPYLEGMLQLYGAWGQYEVQTDREKVQTTFPGEIPDTYLIGGPDEIIELIERYRERLGVTHMLFRLQWPGMPHDRVLRAIELFGAKVIPHFRARR
jgi:alkanesulfonate monooxygenase SsuD/methylene tetrahydromethanopterin reductase-like flavin-dependent oxidoreductase (luciferase family)